MDTTAIVAWYGAIIGTISIALKVVDLYQNSARLKVMIRNSHIIKEYDDYKITVRNTGRRTVTIQRIHVVTNDHYDGKMDRDLFPFELLEGKSATFDYHKDNLTPKQIQYVMVVDAANRMWTGTFERW